jgi:hypothetical protein
MGLAGVLLGLAVLIWQAFRGESVLLLHLHQRFGSQKRGRPCENASFPAGVDSIW